MIYNELITGQNEELMKKTVAIEQMLQKNLNSRLDKLTFKAFASETQFNNTKPHNTNVISIVQVSSTEVNLYKGDTRIFLDSGESLDHIVLINEVRS